MKNIKKYSVLAILTITFMLMGTNLYKISWHEISKNGIYIDYVKDPNYM